MQPHAVLPVPAPVSKPETSPLKVTPVPPWSPQDSLRDANKRGTCFEQGHLPAGFARATMCVRCGALIVREDLAKSRV